jgi:hypothetical protein
MYNTSKLTLFIPPTTTFTSTPRSHTEQPRWAEQQPTLVGLAAGQAFHISCERVEKEHSTVDTTKVAARVRGRCKGARTSHNGNSRKFV